MLTSRSRRSDTEYCPRLRYWAHEAFGTGFEPVKLAIPLTTGVAFHIGAAELLRGKSTDNAVGTALDYYREKTAKRGFDLNELEQDSFVFQEQVALTEALIRVAALRVVPVLTQTYHILEVERMDMAYLVNADDEEDSIIWRSIPDALMAERDDDHDLYQLSWKTASTYDPKKEIANRTDMQGISEAWTWEQRPGLQDSATNGWLWKLAGLSDGIRPPRIRGVQMVYLVKGQRREGRTKGQYETYSPLVRPWRNIGINGYAWRYEWTSQEPGDMYPSTHRLGKGWEPFRPWEAMGTKEWIQMLHENRVQPEAGDCLGQQYAIPVPFYRTPAQTHHWREQTACQEIQIRAAMQDIRPAESMIQYLEEQVRAGCLENLEGLAQARNTLMIKLDHEFPQYTHTCPNFFGRRCPCWDICWGPGHIAENPVGSGLYQIKEPYTGPEPEPVEA